MEERREAIKGRKGKNGTRKSENERREELKGSGTVDLRNMIEDNWYECQLMT